MTAIIYDLKPYTTGSGQSGLKVAFVRQRKLAFCWMSIQSNLSGSIL